MIDLEEFVKVFTVSLASVVEGLSAFVVAVAVVKAIFCYASGFVRTTTDKLTIRLSLGKSLALALEFLLAADILRTAVAPTWEDIGKLAAIAVLRTLLNYFLERELKPQHNP